jgi:hypothetical protein
MPRALQHWSWLSGTAVGMQQQCWWLLAHHQVLLM